jgi:hypothetical protein
MTRYQGSSHNVEQRMITETLATNSRVAEIQGEGSSFAYVVLALLPGWTLGISGLANDNFGLHHLAR